MKRSYVFLMILLSGWCDVAEAVFSPGVIWEVRKTGSDTNGGGFRGGTNMPTPVAPTVSGAASGGTVAAGTYYIVVSLNDGNGETPGSPQSSVTVTGTTSTITVTAPVNPGNVSNSWNVYVGTTNGGPYFSQGGTLPFSSRSISVTPPTSGIQAPGANYSLQDSPQFALTTASTVHTTTTQINVAIGDHIVNAADVGNILNNTGGTATVQRLEITGIDIANNRWTVDKAAGTSGQTLTGVIGGAFAGPGLAGAVAVGSNGVFIKYNATSYICSATANVSGGNFNNGNPAYIVGYDTTRDRNNSDTNWPTLAAGANSLTLLTYSHSTGWVSNLIVDGTGRTAITGINISGPAMVAMRCKANVCATTGISTSSTAMAFGCFASGCGNGFITGIAVGCTATGCGTGFSLSTNGNAISCIAITCTTVGFQCTSTFNLVINCTAYNNTNGFGIVTSGPDGMFINCIAYANTGSGFGTSGTLSNVINCMLLNCAYGANGTNISGGWYSWQIATTVSLTANPFMNAAGQDFRLNAVGGGGALLRTVGYPTTYPGLSTLNYLDIGAVQHRSPGQAQ